MDTFQIANVKFLTIIDVFSKYAQAYPLEPVCNSQIVFENLLTFVSHFGIPKSITCDNGTEFKTSLLIDFCQLHSVQLHFTTPGNSNSNSPIERVHSTLIEIFRVLKIKEPNSCTKQLMQYAVIGYNSSVHSVTKQKPFDVINGRIDSLDPFNMTDEMVLNQFMIDRRERLRTIHEKIYNTSLILKTKQNERQNEKRDNPPEFRPGAKAFVKDKSALRSKTKPRYIKTNVVQDIGNKIITSKNKVIHKSQVQKPKAFCSSSQGNEVDLATAPYSNASSSRSE